jgi:hypothetical protein
MLQHFPFTLHNPGKLLVFLVMLFVLGVWRRNAWLSVSSGIATLSAIVSWHYGYTLSPSSLSLADASAFWFGVLSIGIFLVVMIRDARKEAS